MAVYKFSYRAFSCAPSPAFPRRRRIHRPVVHTALHSGNTFVPVLAVVDSGADDCLFPYAAGVRLGLDVEAGLLQTFSGAGSAGNRAYFHPVEMVIGGQIHLRCQVGFTRAMDAVGLGLLGQAGFFDRFRITFQARRRFLLAQP